MAFSSPLLPQREPRLDQAVYTILDEGFLGHLAFHAKGNPLVLPILYGRKGDVLYLHFPAAGERTSWPLHGQRLGFSVTLLDGVVLGPTLLDTGINYRSVVVFGYVEELLLLPEKARAFQVLADHLVSGRSKEVLLGTESELRATPLFQLTMDQGYLKQREGGPQTEAAWMTEVWTGHIPLLLKAGPPVPAAQEQLRVEASSSVRKFCHRYF